MINTKRSCYTSNPDCPKEINNKQEDGTTFGHNAPLYIIIALLVLIIVVGIVVFLLRRLWQRKKKIDQPVGMSNPQFNGLITIWFRYMYDTISKVNLKNHKGSTYVLIYLPVVYFVWTTVVHCSCFPRKTVDNVVELLLNNAPPFSKIATLRSALITLT